MNALVRKEIRLILPGWIAAMILAVAPAWLVPLGELEIWRKGDGGYWMLSIWLAVGLLLPALTSFGQEFALGTFSTLLAQPISRTRIWLLKLGVLALAAGAALVAGLVSFACRFGGASMVWPFALSSLLLIAVALSGAWWTTLLLRQVTPSLLFSVFIPFLLAISAVGLLVGNVSNQVGMTCLIALLALYAAAGFVVARYLFFNAQDAASFGQIISPWQLTSRATAGEISLGRHKYRPLWMTLCKEFQLQQVTFILAAAMAALHVIDLAVRRFCLSSLVTNPSVRGIVEVAPLLWLLAPLVAGTVAVAEERKLATLESNLCAPISRRLQFTVKLTIALALGLIFGCAAPVLLEQLGHIVGIQGGTDSLTLQGFGIVPIQWVLLYHSLFIALLGFYASTLARNTLQALSIAIAAIIVFDVFATLATDAPRLDGRPLWGIPLGNFVLIPLMLLAFAALAWRNYSHLHFTARLWRRNFAVLLGAASLSVLACSCVYNRLWETWLPIEPFHPWTGFVQFPAPGSAKVIYNDETTAVITKDHRLWIKDKRARFLPGSDWQNAAVSHLASYAIKQDGSLWDITSDPKPFLPDARWRDIVSKNLEFIALNADGSIWNWGSRWSHKKTIDPLPQRQVSPDTDWSIISASPWSVMAAKTDGSIWGWGNLPSPYGAHTNMTVSNPKLCVPASGKQIVAMAAAYGTVYILASDHTLWSANVWFGNQHEPLKQTGAGADWTDLKYSDNGTLLGIKTNGAIYISAETSEGTPSGATLLSGYTCWAGVNRGGVVDIDDYAYRTALAVSTDGWLCRFRYDLPNWPESEWFRRESWMAPSRLKGVRIANLNKPFN